MNHNKTQFPVIYRLLSLGVFLSAIACNSWGQSMSHADENYKRLTEMYQNQQNDSTITKDSIYQKALECCKEYEVILSLSPSATDSYAKSKAILKSLFTFLQAGAGYFSSKKENNSLALVYSKAAIEMAMLKEMDDMGLRKERNYPKIVHFTASHCFNDGDYASAIKYLKEYMAVTDASQHQSVEPFLKQAEQLLAEQQGGKKPFQYVENVPDFSLFAKESIEKGIKDWAQKNPYETMDEYQLRVNETTARTKQLELQKVLQDEYVQRFTREMSITDLQIKPYDADHQTFLISSPYGDIVLTVPRSHNEAQDFAEKWNEVKLYNQNFTVTNNRPALSGLTFFTPTGKTYTYNNNDALAYNETIVDANFITDKNILPSPKKDDAVKPIIGKKELTVGVSDVDVDLPSAKPRNTFTFAVVIANEAYQYVSKVDCALNDGQMFKTYCQKVLGIPETNIRYVENATYGNMLAAIDWLKTVATSFEGEASAILYYAGHGVPDPKDKKAYLLPVDIPASAISRGYSLKDLYNTLENLPVKRSVVFLDACFSGSSRDGEMLAAARGVEIEAEEETLNNGSVVVFSAAQGNQTAHPYTEKKHGLFTYFLLKKLKESKGNTDLGTLSDYIRREVSQRSALMNKPQTPSVTSSVNMSGSWRQIKLK